MTDSRRPFPVARGREKGYDPSRVDEFLLAARQSFESGSDAPLSAGDVRAIAFPLVKRGYQVRAVDAALARIEDAFAARERETAVRRSGPHVWVGESRELAQEVLDRLTRPRARRFRRVGFMHFGYRIDEVDIVADRVARYLEMGEPLTVEQVRAVAFRMQRGGYDEAQVDAVLDAVVGIVLAVG